MYTCIDDSVCTS